MSGVTGDLPAALRTYFDALNAGDLTRAVSCVSDEAVIIIEDTPDRSLEAKGHVGLATWLRQSMSWGAVTIAPLVAKQQGNVYDLEMAVTLVVPEEIKTDDGAIPKGVLSILQQVAYTVEDDKIVKIHARPIRRLPRRRGSQGDAPTA